MSIFPPLSAPLPILLLFTQQTISRGVPPYKPGPAHGFFLLKGSISLPMLLVGGQQVQKKEVKMRSNLFFLQGGPNKVASVYISVTIL